MSKRISAVRRLVNFIALGLVFVVGGISLDMKLTASEAPETRPLGVGPLMGLSGGPPVGGISDSAPVGSQPGSGSAVSQPTSAPAVSQLTSAAVINLPSSTSVASQSGNSRWVSQHGSTAMVGIRGGGPLMRMGGGSVAGLSGGPEMFPVGLYCVDPDPAMPYTVNVTQEFPDIAAAGFNLIQAYMFEGDHSGPSATIADAREYLDAADRFGLKVLMGIVYACVVNRDLECIRETVSALKDHPALFGWELFDEPDTPWQAPAISPETLILAYNTIKQIDPIHPVTIASFLQINESYPYMNGFDIFMSGYLPFPNEPPTTPVMPFSDAAAHVLAPRSKAVIAHVLVYNIANDSLIWPPEWPQSLGRYPTREEIRFTSYYAILRGAKGIFFNCYRFDYGEGGFDRDDVSRMHNPSQWAVISSVSSELRSMVPIFLEPTQDLQSAGISIMGATPVEMMIKQHQGRTYLLTANPSTEPVELPIRLSAERFPNPTITLLPEGRTIPSQDRSFNAQWGAYDVRVYEIAD